MYLFLFLFLIAIAKVYITTNGLAKTQNGRLKLSGLDKAVHGIFISENIGCNKPAKEYFEYIFKKLNITDKSKVVILGTGYVKIEEVIVGVWSKT